MLPFLSCLSFRGKQFATEDKKYIFCHVSLQDLRKTKPQDDCSATDWMAVPCPEFARNLAAGWKTSTEQLCPTSCLQLCSGELDGDVDSYSDSDDDDNDDFCGDYDADNEVGNDNLGDVGGGGGGGGGGDLHHQACGGV